MHTLSATYEIETPEIVLLTSTNDVTTTSAEIDWILPNNLSENGTVTSFIISLKTVKEPNGRENQMANTFASCLMGGEGIANKTLTMPGNTTSTIFTDLSTLSRCRDVDLISMRHLWCLATLVFAGRNGSYIPQFSTNTKMYGGDS